MWVSERRQGGEVPRETRSSPPAERSAYRRSLALPGLGPALQNPLEREAGQVFLVSPGTDSGTHLVLNEYLSAQRGMTDE